MGRNKTIEDDAILSVARRVFREQGHAAATRDVAREAGISQAVLYQRFGSKEDLFFRAMTPDAPELESLFGAYPPKDAHADLTRIGERIAEFLSAFMPTFLHVVSHPAAHGERLREWHGTLPFTPILTGLTARIERMKADGLVGDVSSEMAAFTLVSAAHGLAIFGTMAAHHERATRNPTMRGVVDTLFRGLGPREREGARATPRKR